MIGKGGNKMTEPTNCNMDAKVDQEAISVEKLKKSLFYFTYHRLANDGRVFTYKGQKEEMKGYYESGGGTNRYDGTITMTLVKYFICIVLFSLNSANGNKKKRLKKEIDNARNILKNLNIHSLDGQALKIDVLPLDKETLDQIGTVLASPSRGFYGTRSVFNFHVSPSTFNEIEINSKPLAFLLYHFTGLGENKILIKDFKDLGKHVQETAYEKETFKYQKVIDVLRDEFLLLMILEALSEDSSPADLVKTYNDHAKSYNDILEKLRKQKLPKGIIGSIKIGSEGDNKSDSSNYTYDFPEYKLAPDETYYEDYKYPNLVHNLSKEEQERVVLILIDLYNLPVSKDLVMNAKKEMQSEVKVRYENIELKFAISNESEFMYPIKSSYDYQALEYFSTLTKDIHLVFNRRIIEILKSIGITHPFKHIDPTDYETNHKQS